jgi:predicted metal-dependent hydrolase
MTRHIQLGDITVDVMLKEIKNIHLSVYPPNGRVKVSAPLHMSLDTIRVFVISKLAWIKQQQKKLQEQLRETPREYLDKESHYVWGNRYLLKVIELAEAPSVELRHKQMLLKVRPGTSEEKKQVIMDEWYRELLKDAVPSIILKWETIMGVCVERIFVQRMKTKWGSCNPAGKSIRLNTELAKKPRECLEYIVVHEMAHLLESTHNNRFIALMEGLLPQWRHYREELNWAPLGHVEWGY